MRYFLILLAVFTVLAVNAYKPSVSADTSHPEFAGRTCGGQEVLPTMQRYFFGFNGEKGYCMTRPFQANTYGEARECARRSCPTCMVSDITAWYSFSTSDQDANNPQNFCPARK